MSFRLLFLDELRGFYKSKVMVILWIGVPLLTLLMRIFQNLDPGQAEIPMALISMIVVSQIGGMLSAIMLSTSIVNERNKHVYDLFLIRPVKRYNLITAKYFAVITCLMIAIVISLTTGYIIDLFIENLQIPAEYWNETIENFILGLASMSISCCFGVLFGISVNSVAAAAILSTYIGTQLSSVLTIIIIYIENINKILLSSIIGVAFTVILLTLSILLFCRKQI